MGKGKYSIEFVSGVWVVREGKWEVAYKNTKKAAEKFVSDAVEKVVLENEIFPKMGSAYNGHDRD